MKLIADQFGNRAVKHSRKRHLIKMPALFKAI